MKMTRALATRINKLGLGAGPVPCAPGYQAAGGQWVDAPPQTAVRIVERALLGEALTGPEGLWLRRFLLLGLVRGLVSK